MKSLTIRIVMLVGLALCACTGNTVRTDAQRIEIANGVFLVLPQSAELTESFDAVQAISAAYEDRSFSFEAHIRARPGTLSIVALGALGGALFSISYDGSELVAEGAQQARAVAPEFVLADVLLTHWDVDWLRRRLEGAAIEVTADGTERFVTRDGQLLIGVAFDSSDPWGGNARLTHLERGYVLHIATARFTTP